MSSLRDVSSPPVATLSLPTSAGADEGGPGVCVCVCVCVCWRRGGGGGRAVGGCVAERVSGLVVQWVCEWVGE
jgi:hypothetical protein